MKQDFSLNIACSFLRPKEMESLAAIVADVEKNTSAEIVLSVVGKATKPRNLLQRLFSRKSIEDRVHDFAVKNFLDLGIQQTEGATGVMVMIAVQERRIEVVADKAINEKVEQSKWDSYVNIIAEHIRKGDPVFGIGETLKDIGRLLAEHFPIKEGDKNELSNEVRAQ